MCILKRMIETTNGVFFRKTLWLARWIWLIHQPWNNSATSCAFWGFGLTKWSAILRRNMGLRVVSWKTYEDVSMKILGQLLQCCKLLGLWPFYGSVGGHRHCSFRSRSDRWKVWNFRIWNFHELSFQDLLCIFFEKKHKQNTFAGFPFVSKGISDFPVRG